MLLSLVLLFHTNLQVLMLLCSNFLLLLLQLKLLKLVLNPQLQLLSLWLVKNLLQVTLLSKVLAQVLVLHGCNLLQKVIIWLSWQMLLLLKPHMIKFLLLRTQENNI